MTLRCLIVDDEPSGRKVMQELVEDTPFLHLQGVAEHPVKALACLQEAPVDLLFLDIRMPRMSGIDFLKSLHQPPLAIITSAYPEYALQSFELDVIDYLLKPVSLERFLKAATKARDFAALKQAPAMPLAESADYFFVKCNDVYERICYEDVLFVESLNNFVNIQTRHRKYVTWLTTKSLEESLPPGRFLRIHRSYIVAVAKIERIAGNEVCLGNHSLPISKSLRADVMAYLVRKNLLQR